ncbi:putative contactin-4-like, partial [Scophthalmus maximus]
VPFIFLSSVDAIYRTPVSGLLHSHTIQVPAKFILVRYKAFTQLQQYYGEHKKVQNDKVLVLAAESSCINNFLSSVQMRMRNLKSLLVTHEYESLCEYRKINFTIVLFICEKKEEKMTTLYHGTDLNSQPAVNETDMAAMTLNEQACSSIASMPFNVLAIEVYTQESTRLADHHTTKQNMQCLNRPFKYELGSSKLLQNVEMKRVDAIYHMLSSDKAAGKDPIQISSLQCCSPPPLATQHWWPVLCHSPLRQTIMEDGTLRITNISKSDGGRYTCVARNHFGTSSNTGMLLVKEPTRIVVPPLSLDATVGQSLVLPCEVFSDSSLSPVFKWFFNGKTIDVIRQEHFEMIGGGFAGDLMVRNIQLKHSGKYVCMVHTEVDTVSAAADLIVRGPPGAPEGLVVTDITDTTVQLSWGSGPDNHSPVTMYMVQARTPFSIGWQTVRTVPDSVPGQMIHATVKDLSPWVDYEFRVVAINSVGVGEPSTPSKQIRTKAAVPKVAPVNVSGGGGARGELVIIWEPVPEEQQSGDDFGYVVAFRPLGSSTWIQTVLASPDASRYVYRNDSIAPLSPFEVMVGVYNSLGEGQFSRVVQVFSAEEEPSEAPSKVWGRSLSASEIAVYWEPVPLGSRREKIVAYEVLFWEEGARQSDADRVKVINTIALLSGLKGSTVYQISVRAQNSAGLGPCSPAFNITTKKPPPSQPPGNIEWSLTNSKIFLNWEHVKAMENESEVTGYKVMYRQDWQGGTTVLETNKTSVELQIPSGEDYFIEIKTLTKGGDGTSSGPIRIPKMSTSKLFNSSM